MSPNGFLCSTGSLHCVSHWLETRLTRLASEMACKSISSRKRLFPTPEILPWDAVVQLAMAHVFPLSGMRFLVPFPVVIPYKSDIASGALLWLLGDVSRHLMHQIFLSCVSFGVTRARKVSRHLCFAWRFFS